MNYSFLGLISLCSCFPKKSYPHFSDMETRNIIVSVPLPHLKVQSSMDWLFRLWLQRALARSFSTGWNREMYKKVFFFRVKSTFFFYIRFIYYYIVNCTYLKVPSSDLTLLFLMPWSKSELVYRKTEELNVKTAVLVFDFGQNLSRYCHLLFAFEWVFLQLKENNKVLQEQSVSSVKAMSYIFLILVNFNPEFNWCIIEGINFIFIFV